MQHILKTNTGVGGYEQPTQSETIQVLLLERKLT